MLDSHGVCMFSILARVVIAIFGAEKQKPLKIQGYFCPRVVYSRWFIDKFCWREKQFINAAIEGAAI